MRILAATILAAGLALPASAQYVSITLRGGQGQGPRAQDWEPAARRLLAADARAEWIRVGPELAPRLRVSASGWAPSLGASERDKGLVFLKSAWGERLLVEESSRGRLPDAQPAAPPPLDATRLMDRGQTRKLVERHFDDLLAGKLDQAFDGGGGPRGAPVSPVSAAGPGPRAASPRVGAASPLSEPATAKEIVVTVRPFATEIAKAAHEAGIDPEILRAVVAAKSSFDPNRKGGGAIGLMGISPAAGRAYGVKPEELLKPETNLAIGAQLLAGLIDLFRDCAKGDNECRDRPPPELELHRALAAYQIGPGEVSRSRGVPQDEQVKHFLGAFNRAYRPAKSPAGRPPAPGSRGPVEYPRGGIGRELREDLRDRLTERPIPGYLRASAAWRGLIRKTAAEFGMKVDENLYIAMIHAESSGIPTAIGDKPKKGKKGVPSCGLGQIKPTTANGFLDKHDYTCEDLLDPETNIRIMIRYFEGLRRRFGLYGGVSAYNQGEGAYARDGADNTTHLRRVDTYYRALTGSTIRPAPPKVAATP